VPVFSDKISPFVAFSLKIIKSVTLKSTPVGSVIPCNTLKFPVKSNFPASFLTLLLFNDEQ
jgi:hypothetical protein